MAEKMASILFPVFWASYCFLFWDTTNGLSDRVAMILCSLLFSLLTIFLSYAVIKVYKEIWSNN